MNYILMEQSLFFLMVVVLISSPHPAFKINTRNLRINYCLPLALPGKMFIKLHCLAHETNIHYGNKICLI